MSSQAPQHGDDVILKRLTTGGFAALGTGLAAMVVLHATSGLNPVEVVISLHLYTPLGWLLPFSLALLGTGACAFAAAASRVGAPRWMSRMLLAWAGLLALVALFPTDPPGLPEVSLVSAIHRYSAFCAFSTMAVMGVVFSRWARHEDRCPPRVRLAVSGFSWLAVAALVSCSTPYVMEWFGVPREPGAYAAGLLQRTTVGSEMVVLAVFGLWLREHRAESPAPAPAVPRSSGEEAGGALRGGAPFEAPAVHVAAYAPLSPAAVGAEPELVGGAQ
jgi:hypothetical protein